MVIYIYYQIMVICGECINEKNIQITGEPSGDKLASKVIREINKDNQEIEYLSVGGENLKALGIKSIYDLKEITYIGFTNVINNILKLTEKSMKRLML